MEKKTKYTAALLVVVIAVGCVLWALQALPGTATGTKTRETVRAGASSQVTIGGRSPSPGCGFNF